MKITAKIMVDHSQRNGHSIQMSTAAKGTVDHSIANTRPKDVKRTSNLNIYSRLWASGQ